MHSQKVTTLTLESIEQFRSSLSVRGHSTQTTKAYSTDLRVLLAEVEMEEITQEELQEVGSNWLTGNRKVVAVKTTQRRLTSLRAWCRWAGWGPLFADYVSPTAAPGVPHPLPEGMDGIESLIAVARREEQKALIALCGMCGLRVHEALATKASDFNLETMELKVLGKGSKERWVPVSTRAWEVLANSVTRAFLNNPFDSRVVPMQDRFARRVITNLGTKAGLKRSIASHDLRATFATELYNATLDKKLVQDILGHSSGDTTDVYILRDRQQKHEGVEKLRRDKKD